MLLHLHDSVRQLSRQFIKYQLPYIAYFLRTKHWAGYCVHIGTFNPHDTHQIGNVLPFSQMKKMRLFKITGPGSEAVQPGLRPSDTHIHVPCTTCTCREATSQGLGGPLPVRASGSTRMEFLSKCCATSPSLVTVLLAEQLLGCRSTEANQGKTQEPQSHGGVRRGQGCD